VRTCTLRVGLTAALALVLSACAAGKAESPAWNELEALHATPAVREAAALAPVPFAAAERARVAAEHACDSGHDAACEATVDEALAGYALTEATARGLRARTRAEAARASLTEQGRAGDEAAAARTTAEREASELGAELEVATHVAPPRASGPAPAAREEARGRAAASLAEGAELLCDAARLAGSSTDDPALLKVREELATKPAAGRGGGPLLDDATRARAACLTQLTTARARGTAIDSEAEAILAAVSARGLGDDLTVHRDERGVLVGLEAPFDKDHLTTRARGALEALAAIALAHPKSALQMVAHDQSGSEKNGTETAEHRALVEHRLDDAAHVLDAAGISATRRHTVRAYDRLPIVDPADAAHRARNERLEVVFVSTS
jgi:outer membrane protein OmpA-like peptidoglycan-associated protein